MKLRCNFSDTSSSFRPPICFVFKTEKIRRGTASIRDCKQTLQSDGIVLPIELLFTILISLECKPAKTKVRDQQRLEEFGTGPNMRAVALFSEELFLVQVSFSIARFPNCHECPEVSGLGNLTSVSSLYFDLPQSINFFVVQEGSASFGEFLGFAKAGDIASFAELNSMSSLFYVNGSLTQGTTV